MSYAKDAWTGLSPSRRTRCRAVVRLCRSVEKVVSEHGLTLAQFRILDRLADGSAGGANLADWLAVKPPSVTTVVDGLVKRRLVERTVDADDRRRVTHALTPDGRTLHATVSDSVAHRLGEVLAALPEDGRPATQYRTMIEALAAWNEAFDEALASPPGRVRCPAVIPTSDRAHRGVGWRPPRRGMDPRPRTDRRAVQAHDGGGDRPGRGVPGLPRPRAAGAEGDRRRRGGRRPALARVDRGPRRRRLRQLRHQLPPPAARRRAAANVQHDLHVAIHGHMHHLDAARHDNLAPAT